MVTHFVILIVLQSLVVLFTALNAWGVYLREKDAKQRIEDAVAARTQEAVNEAMRLCTCRNNYR